MVDEIMALPPLRARWAGGPGGGGGEASSGSEEVNVCGIYARHGSTRLQPSHLPLL